MPIDPVSAFLGRHPSRLILSLSRKNQKIPLQLKLEIERAQQKTNSNQTNLLRLRSHLTSINPNSRHFEPIFKEIEGTLDHLDKHQSELSVYSTKKILSSIDMLTLESLIRESQSNILIPIYPLLKKGLIQEFQSNIDQALEHPSDIHTNESSEKDYISLKRSLNILLKETNSIFAYTRTPEGMLKNYYKAHEELTKLTMDPTTLTDDDITDQSSESSSIATHNAVAPPFSSEKEPTPNVKELPPINEAFLQTLSPNEARNSLIKILESQSVEAYTKPPESPDSDTVEVKIPLKREANNLIKELKLTSKYTSTTEGHIANYRRASLKLNTLIDHHQHTPTTAIRPRTSSTETDTTTPIHDDTDSDDSQKTPRPQKTKPYPQRSLRKILPSG